MEKVLVSNTQKCVGCRICEQWCSMEHFGIINPTKSRIRVIRIHEAATDVPLSCSQCDPAPCQKACSVDAITRNEKTGALIVNEGLCFGCQKCVKACPNGAVSFVKETKKALICDLCDGDPVCAKVCPEGAVQYTSVSSVDASFKAQAAKEIAASKEGK